MINTIRNKKPKGDGKVSSQLQIAEEVIEALELLHKAAREEKEEVKKIIRKNVLELADLLAVKNDQVREMIDKSQEELEKQVSQIDEKIHENPWPYIAATAIGAFFIGQYMKNK